MKETEQQRPLKAKLIFSQRYMNPSYSLFPISNFMEMEHFLLYQRFYSLIRLTNLRQTLRPRWSN